METELVLFCHEGRWNQDKKSIVSWKQYRGLVHRILASMELLGIYIGSYKDLRKVEVEHFLPMMMRVRSRIFVLYCNHKESL